MVTLPLPLISGLSLGFLFLRMVLGQGRLSWLAVLVGAVAVQAVIVALALHYGLAQARLVQPLTAMALPALAWLGWKADGLGLRPGARDAWHLAGPLVALGLQLHAAPLLEGVVPLAYLGYAAALAWSISRSQDVPRGRLSDASAPRRVWAGLAGALALSAASDLVIAGAILSGHAQLVPRIVDLFTAALLLGVGLLALRASAVSTGPSDNATPAPSAEEADHALVAWPEEHMRLKQAWREPDLTLTQLAPAWECPPSACQSRSIL